jgi:hypothetical protein
MDTVLITVTALSLAMAIGMGVVIARLLRDDRERSEARVAVLAAMAGDPAPRQRQSAEAATVPSTDAASRRPSPEPFADLELGPVHPGMISSAELFAPRTEPSPWGRRFAVIGTLAALLVATAFVLTAGRTPSQSPPVPAPAAYEGTPLELVALRHIREPRTLTVSGVVHNPATGAPVSRLVATAFVFGPGGAFLTSSRAPLDVSTLAPGDESRFVVAVPVDGEVSRYRIGFRTEDGRVVAHVDKRTPDTLARKQEQP